jgi:hypothetical protein
MLTNLKFFTVHNGYLFAMSENGTTFRTPVIGNTGWVRLTNKITGREPNDSEAHLSTYEAHDKPPQTDGSAVPDDGPQASMVPDDGPQADTTDTKEVHDG